MSYAKAMKHVNGHRKDRFYQPILCMPFNDLKPGQHQESGKSIALRTATGYNVRVSQTLGQDRNEFQQVSGEFKTEDEAVDYINNNIYLEQQYKYVRVYSTEGMHISGW
ncbi:MAG: hypothetical protein WCR33_04115 [Bacilli bacterium]|jgi:hypothetical protein